MKKHFTLDEQPYIDLIRYAPMSDRLNLAFDYIDKVVELYVTLGKKDDGHSMVALIKQGLKGWKKICRYNIVVDADSENEYLLESQTFPDYLLKRFLDTAKSESEYNMLKKTLRKMYLLLGFEFTDSGTWAEYGGLE